MLYRNTPDGLDRTLACALGAAVLFVVANAFPIVGLDAQGNHTSTTLFGTMRALQRRSSLRQLGDTHGWPSKVELAAGLRSKSNRRRKS